MKKLFLMLLMAGFTVLSYSQNMEIDSLVHVIEDKENEIENIKHRIIEIIKEEGYLTQAYPKYDWKQVIELKEDEDYGARVLDTIPVGAEITILEKEIGHYKISYENQVGYLSTLDIEITDTPIEYLPYTTKYGDYTPTHSSTSSSRTSNYSKPIHVKGHYRTTKSGKRVYVRPHTRKSKY